MLRLILASSLALIAEAATFDTSTIGAYMTASAARGGTVTFTRYGNNECTGAGTPAKGLCPASLPDLVAGTGDDSGCDQPFYQGVCYTDYTGMKEVAGCNADNTKVLYTSYQSTTECSGPFMGPPSATEYDSGECVGRLKFTCAAGAVYDPNALACTFSSNGCCDGDDTTAVKTDTFGTNCVGGQYYANSDELKKAVNDLGAAVQGMAIGVLVAVIVIPILALVLIIVGIVCCCKHCGKKTA